MGMTDINDTRKVDGSINDLTIYGSNFGELKESKIKYHVRIFLLN
jgi:hypothetical protein